MIFFQGEYLQAALKKERVTTVEVLAAMRDRGFSDVEDVGAVVLETDGSFTVLKRTGPSGTSTLQAVVRPKQQ